MYFRKTDCEYYVSESWVTRILIDCQMQIPSGQRGHPRPRGVHENLRLRLPAQLPVARKPSRSLRFPDMDIVPSVVVVIVFPRKKSTFNWNKTSSWSNWNITRLTEKRLNVFFKMGHPGLFFIYFRLFKHTLQFSQQINVNKCPSSIHSWD